MPYLEARDGTRLFYLDCGEGMPVVLVSSAWLNSGMWEQQIPELVRQGFRCIAYDRRGHGRSDSPWAGYDYDTLADDLRLLITRLGLTRVAFVSHSAGAGEVVRYVTRHGAGVVAGVALISPTTPFPMKAADNPAGIDRAAMEADLAARTHDRPQWFADNAAGFFGIGLPGIEVSPELVQHMIRECLTCSARATAEFFVTSFTTDFRDELRSLTVPAVVIHGDHDRQAPIDICGRRTAELVTGCEWVVYEHAAHALFLTHAQRLNADLVGFLTRLRVGHATGEHVAWAAAEGRTGPEPTGSTPPPRECS
jgi:non-heme chloroperoxidase